MRLKPEKSKKRFEIACYKNKVLDWRNGNEKNIDEVIQIPNVFINVSKGETAKKDDLVKAFGKDMSRDDIILKILNDGKLEVGDKERAAELERIRNEVVSIVAGKLVNPDTKRVYTTGMIEKALDQLSVQGSQENKEKHEHKEEEEPKKHLPTWTGVKDNKDAKSQALMAMKAMIARQPIKVERARMILKVVIPAKFEKFEVKIKHEDKPQEKVNMVEKILSYFEQEQNKAKEGDEWMVEGYVEPGDYKLLSEFIATYTKGLGRVDIIEQAVKHED